MPASVVVEVRALNSGTLLNSNGLIVHAVWFKGWAEKDETVANEKHQNGSQTQPFTVSPMMNLPADAEGICQFRAGQCAWFRVCTLSDDLTDNLPTWLEGIRKLMKLDLKDTVWQVERIAVHSDEHPWAGHISYPALQQVVNAEKQSRFTLEFSTPMTLHGEHYFPFPQPESLVRSWLERWDRFSGIKLPEDLPEDARHSLLINRYNLKTSTVRMHGEKFPGCVGEITLQVDKDLREESRRALCLLARYAFFCGSGYKTTQGLGQTRVISRIW